MSYMESLKTDALLAVQNRSYNWKIKLRWQAYTEAYIDLTLLSNLFKEKTYYLSIESIKSAIFGLDGHFQ